MPQVNGLSWSYLLIIYLMLFYLIFSNFHYFSSQFSAFKQSYCTNLYCYTLLI